VFNGLVITPFIVFLAIAFPPDLQLEVVPEPLGIDEVLYYPLFFAMDHDRGWCIGDSARDRVCLCF
jgi:hypothetical protein